jgi:uncharacterized protein (DUF1697 family)
MPVYVGLLRAIGPITHARMSMAALREKCEAAGFGNVATVLNTGNLLLTSERSAADVRKVLQVVVDGFAMNSEVFVRTPRQLAALVKANPFPEAASDHPSAFGVCFFQRTPEWPAWVISYDGPERLAAATNHLCIDYRSQIAGSRLDIEKRLGVRMTMRNWNTVVTLAARSQALAMNC